MGNFDLLFVLFCFCFFLLFFSLLLFSFYKLFVTNKRTVQVKRWLASHFARPLDDFNEERQHCQLYN